jgi:hypothetical protein
MTGYINTLNNSFGLFQYYFWQLIQILPFILLIIWFILLFYMIIKK